MSSSKERAGPSGYQKKARTISSTKFLQVTSGGAEVVEMGSSSQPKPADSDSSGPAAVRARVGSISVVAPSDQDTCTPTRPRGKAGKSDAAAMPTPPSPRRTPKRKSLDVPAILPREL